MAIDLQLKSANSKKLYHKMHTQLCITLCLNMYMHVDISSLVIRGSFVLVIRYGI